MDLLYQTIQQALLRVCLHTRIIKIELYVLTCLRKERTNQTKEKKQTKQNKKTIILDGSSDYIKNGF